MNNVLIIDSQPVYSEALASLVKCSIKTNKVIESTDLSNIMNLIRKTKIDLIILDSIVEGHDGIRIASNILATGYHGRLLFISSQDYTSLSKTVYEIGGHGFVSKNEKKETIVDAIVSVCKGYSIFKTNHLSSKEGIKLSKREVIVFNYLSKGYSNKRISEQLSLSAKTISTYKARILKKYQADSFIEILNATQNNRKIKVPY